MTDIHKAMRGRNHNDSGATDSNLNDHELIALEQLIDQRGIAEVLIAISEICGAKADHIRTNWQDRPLARRWETMEGAIGVAVPKGAGL